MTALAKHQERAGEVATPLPEADAFLSMLERAARDPSVDVDKMRQLVELRKDLRREDRLENASIAFNEAFADMQPNLPAVAKRGASNNGAYATWEDIQAAINPVLHAHGFGLMFKTDTGGERVKVTAILRHRGGHSESTDFELKPDKSGNKQDVHAVASAVSYAKRYAAGALLNIQTSGEDDDGKAAEGQSVDEAAVKAFVAKADKHKASVSRLLKAVGAENIHGLTPKLLKLVNEKLDAWISSQKEAAQ
jgi:hypothetical protein